MSRNSSPKRKQEQNNSFSRLADQTPDTTLSLRRFTALKRTLKPKIKDLKPAINDQLHFSYPFIVTIKLVASRIKQTTHQHNFALSNKHF